MFLSWLSFSLSVFFIFMYLISVLLGSPVMCSTFWGWGFAMVPQGPVVLLQYNCNADKLCGFMAFNLLLFVKFPHGFQYWMCVTRHNSCVKSPGVSVDYVSSKTIFDVVLLKCHPYCCDSSDIILTFIFVFLQAIEILKCLAHYEQERSVGRQAPRLPRKAAIATRPGLYQRRG